MINLDYLFNNAADYVEHYAEGSLPLAALPGTVFLFQQELINQYEHGVSCFVLYSSCKTQEALEDRRVSANHAFMKVSYCIESLMRYTFRLYIGTKLVSLFANMQFDEERENSWQYSSVYSKSQPLGLYIDESHQCRLTLLKKEENLSYEKCERYVDLSDEAEITNLQMQMELELEQLKRAGGHFQQVCQKWYESHPYLQTEKRDHTYEFPWI